MVCLAVDIGATSARLIVSHEKNGAFSLEEIHRFKTPLVQEGEGHCHWDVEKLFSEILFGLKKAKELGEAPDRIGIDCFGVDYALLDENDRLIGDVTSYRDVRTFEAKKEFLTPEGLFLRNGVYPQNFDSVYQLYCDKQSGKLAKAKTFMMLASYLCYRLTGVKQNELSALSTSALLDERTGKLSEETLKDLGISSSLFPEIIPAGTKIGHFAEAVKQEVGYDAEVYAALEHDTASAFFGSGAERGALLLSSGTWSLLGCILPQPIITKEAYEKGFTNELSRPGEVRLLQNIMGMWVVNRLKEELGIASFSEVTRLASEASAYPGVFDATDDSLSNPESMKDAVLALLTKDGYSAPKDNGELFYCVYHSLAKTYAKAAKGIEQITGSRFSSLCIFGGGVQAEILNRLTEEETNFPVKRGPSEATAIGVLKILFAA